MINKEGTIIGIDIGSVSVSIVQIDLSGKIINSAYDLHHGNPEIKLSSLLSSFNTDNVLSIVSPRGKMQMNEQVELFDPQVSLIRAAKERMPDVSSILHIGAEKFFLISLDPEGNYDFTASSSSCAAGTGSFLDQQAKRLYLKDSGDLARMAIRNIEKTPEIASRCAVFAKTDLIHAQQQGFSLGSICDSLCKGLAENIIDTLFNKHDPVLPLLISGGVSCNQSVVSHIERILDIKVTVPENSSIMMAFGASLLSLDDINQGKKTGSFDFSILMENEKERDYYYKPLSGTTMTYPDFEKGKFYRFSPIESDHAADVQVDLYDDSKRKVKEPEATELNSAESYPQFILGIDIGSTSTKAMLIDDTGNPQAGFYTYTSGQPLKAVQAIFEAISAFKTKNQLAFTIRGCGTTGSGRKFIGNIIKADQIYDEITAHAAAAYTLNPKTDTIIEIGGQDAKFTVMKDGVVTFSHMNTVCAAGTGSFIEELAGKMDVSLYDYSKRSENVSAPLASDRCTVFMERDINQLQSSGYTVDEVLATVLHSVRENYLKKVANEAQIGDHICFQGATAKNRALVSAFEQRLGKEIYVSKYCHLTGALGVAFLLQNELDNPSRFIGLDIYKKDIPLSTESCELCLNNCLITLAEVNGNTEAYGFLCGRDYNTTKYVDAGKSGFNLLKARSGIKIGEDKKKEIRSTTIGIPATLHMRDDLDFWKDFFKSLSFPVKSSEKYKDSLNEGKRMAGAEFCAPVDAMYGHVAYLKEKVDYIFMPTYLESRVKPAKSERNYCYYTQFSTSLAFLQGKGEYEAKFISPLLNFNRKKDQLLMQLHRSLNSILPGEILFEQVNRAYNLAQKHSELRNKALVSLFENEFSISEDISVVCLGRPYVVLSEVLNKGIPDIFSKLGIKAFYQDMLPLDDNVPENLEILINKVPWHFAAIMLQVAEKIGRTPNLYPVFITAFKCAPDSFIIDYFKEIMHQYDKPYLIIQVDEHDSNVGYETRIEAAIRSFRNHKEKGLVLASSKLEGLLPEIKYEIDGKTLMMPFWDTFISPLIVANLRRSGIDARLLDSSELSIRKSMAHNTGQCLPVNIIAQNYIEYIEKHKLDPENTILWMLEGWLSCNIRQYPFFIKKVLENYGKGLEKSAVYSGKVPHTELSYMTTYHAYFAYMLGGLFRKVACRIRPYEYNSGETDRILDQIQGKLVDMFEKKQSIETAIKKCFELVETIKYDTKTRRPMVAIFGDFYVRDNDIMNQDLLKDIEEAGGEAITTPYHDYVKITLDNVLRRSLLRGEYIESSMNRALMKLCKVLDDRYYKPFEKYLGPSPLIRPRELEKHLKSFNIDLNHSGESYDNILKIFYIIQNYPDVSLFVQTNPAYCCPSLITEAMTHKIKEMTGISIVTITYDGTSEKMNDVIVPYIKSAQASREPSQQLQ